MKKNLAKKTFTAGGVVVNREGQVVVVNQGGNSWSLPKGHVDKDENPRQAAAREIREESGIKQLTFIKELGSYERYQIGPGGKGETDELKHITMFLFSTDESNLKPEDPHNPEARWVTPAEALELLTHPKDREFFKEILPEIEGREVDR